MSSYVGPRPVRPAFPFYGGKARLADRIVSLMPPHRVYLEPFVGSGAVLLRKPICKHEIVNDTDGGVVAFFRAMRECPDELRYALTYTPYAREEYETAAGVGDDLPLVERARRFVVRAGQSINAAGAAGSPGWALSTTRNQSRPGTWANAMDRLDVIAERVRRVYIEHSDAVDAIRRHGRSDDAVIYADPPYLAGVRSGSLDSSAYRHDAHSEAEHLRFLDAFLSARATVIVSGYDSPLYREALAGWATVEVNIGKPSANTAGTVQTASIEKLWINREGGIATHA